MFAFMDSLLYRVPGTSPAEFRMQPFFVWYAPRIPHQPLRSPKPIDDYLFGTTGSYPLGGLFNLGALCSGGSCPPTVSAMNETNFGTDFEMFGNVYWMDDGLREIRPVPRAREPAALRRSRRHEPVRRHAGELHRHLGFERHAGSRPATPSSCTSPTTAGTCPTRSTSSPRTATGRA